MPIQIQETTNGYYIPMDGPWQSEEDNLAYKAAETKYNKLVAADLPYVALIQSHHEYSHGYWIEIIKEEVKFPDHILKEHISK